MSVSTICDEYCRSCVLLDEANFQLMMHNLDLGSDTSSVWNFCSRSSEFISRGKQEVASRNICSFLRLP